MQALIFIAADTAHHNLTLSLSVLCFGLGFLQFLHRFTLHLRIGGIVVSIAAFQAVDPGSIPGQRKLFNQIFYALNLERAGLHHPTIAASVAQ